MPMTRALTISFAVLISLASIPLLHAEDLKEIATQSSQGQHSAAMERINNHIKAHPNDVQALFMRAVMLAEQNRKDDAIRAFTEITEKFPGYDEKNFEIEYDNSSGIGYSIFMVVKWKVNGVDGDFRIPIADETDW